MGDYDPKEATYYWEYKVVRANVEGVEMGDEEKVGAGADIFEDLTDSDDND